MPLPAGARPGLLRASSDPPVALTPTLCSERLLAVTCKHETISLQRLTGEPGLEARQLKQMTEPGCETAARETVFSLLGRHRVRTLEAKCRRPRHNRLALCDV